MLFLNEMLLPEIFIAVWYSDRIQAVLNCQRDTNKLMEYQWVPFLGQHQLIHLCLLEEFMSDELINDIAQFYMLHLDDTLSLVKPEDVDMILRKFNSFDRNIQFTVDKFLNGNTNTDDTHRSAYTFQQQHSMAVQNHLDTILIPQINKNLQ